MRRHRSLRFFTRPKRQTSRRPLGLRRGKSSTPSTHVRVDWSSPHVSPRALLEFWSHHPRAPIRRKRRKLRVPNKVGRKRGERTHGQTAEFISHISVSLEARHSTEKTNFKMAPNFFPLRRRSRFFHSPLAGGARASERTCCISKCATFFFPLPLPPSPSSCLICPPRGFHSVLAPSICTSVKQGSLPSSLRPD